MSDPSPSNCFTSVVKHFVECPNCGKLWPYDGHAADVCCGGCSHNFYVPPCATIRRLQSLERGITFIARQLTVRDKMLAALWAEYEDRKTQWGGDYLWTKHEDADAIAEVKAFIAQTQNRKKCWHRCQRENAMKTEPTPTLAAVVQPRLVRRCVSHHFACDCREAAFAELLKDVMQLHSDPNGAQYNKCDTAPCSWCEEAKRLMLHGHPDTTPAQGDL
jgi:hypothetical protein